MQNQIIEILKNTIKEKYSIEVGDIKLSNPPKWVDWDFSVNVWFLARDLKKNPKIIAEELAEEIKNQNNEVIENISYLNWFINIKLSESIFTKQFLEHLKPHPNPLLSGEGNNWKTIIIDYIWANIWKPLHIGHMCTPNLGQSMINIYRKLGYNVIWDNHLGDWGIIFGKLIFAYKYFGEKKEELEKSPIEYLLKLYIDITSEAEEKPELEEWFRETFQKLSSWDKNYIELWKDFTSYSVSDLRIQLKRLNVKPDFNIWESFFEWLNLPKLEDIPDLECGMKCVVKELIKEGIATQNTDNSVWVEFEEKTKIPSCILQKRDGTHWYLASDLAAVKYRKQNWNPEKIIYFTDSRQQLHFRQLFEISANANFIEKEKLFHGFNWFISLKDWAMSTRKWRIIKLDVLLDEAEARAKKIILEKRDDLDENELIELSRIIWIWAIKYWYLKKNRETDVIFDWDEFMSFEGNSWPYIQYAYVRALRLLEKSPNLISPKGREVTAVLKEKEEIDLIKKILEYKSILIETTKNNYPHILANYAYELTKLFNSFYNNIHIISEKDDQLKNLKLALVSEFSKTIKDAFELLAIEMPERM